MRYQVHKLKTAPAIDAAWDRPPWPDVTALKVDQHMGERPAHFPAVLVRLAYDADAVNVMFRVEDRYVRAAAEQHQDPVCADSCVEFFFVPGEDVSAGYFNLEMNCGGIMLFHFQRQPRKNPVPVAAGDLARIQVAHSLPMRVDPERTESVTWTVAYRLPFALLAGYRPAERPAPGTIWRANFYKCADQTSHPHWLTWAPVRRARPDFHVPEDFGVLEFR
jgi:hypothetical protein